MLKWSYIKRFNLRKMVSKTTMVSVVVVIILIVLGVWYTNRSTDQEMPATEEATSASVDATTAMPAGDTETAEMVAEIQAPENFIVTYSKAEGFVPSSIEAKVGSTITFLNKTGANVQIASDLHPIHTNNPDFDSGTLAENSSWSFTFSKAGTYGFHDHLNPGSRGSATVK